jgi:hypothetical protein
VFRDEPITVSEDSATTHSRRIGVVGAGDAAPGPLIAGVHAGDEDDDDAADEPTGRERRRSIYGPSDTAKRAVCFMRSALHGACDRTGLDPA